MLCCIPLVCKPEHSKPLLTRERCRSPCRKVERQWEGSRTAFRAKLLVPTTSSPQAPVAAPCCRSQRRLWGLLALTLAVCGQLAALATAANRRRLWAPQSVDCARGQPLDHCDSYMGGCRRTRVPVVDISAGTSDQVSSVFFSPYGR